MIRIFCRQADAILKETQTLTKGMLNYPTVLLTFDEAWDGMGKAAVVRAGETVVDVLITDNKFVVPAECLAEAGVNLIIGVSGSDGTTTIPTIWCSAGEILEGTDVNEGQNLGTATTSLVDQMLAYAQAAADYAEDMDESVIRTISVRDDDANQYGEIHVYVSDTGAGENRTVTFDFRNLKGNGIESLTFATSGDYKGRVQVRLDNGTVTNFDGIAEALDALEDFEANISDAEEDRVEAEEARVAAEADREEQFDEWGDLVGDSEAWAQGTKDGQPIPSTHPAYGKDSKHYSELSETAKDASVTAKDTSNARALDSEAWAVGKRGGVDVEVTDETYHNNAAFYADAAEQGAATAGYMDLYIDNNGHLIYQRSSNVNEDFYIDSNGHLIWEVG